MQTTRSFRSQLPSEATMWQQLRKPHRFQQWWLRILWQLHLAAANQPPRWYQSPTGASLGRWQSKASWRNRSRWGFSNCLIRLALIKQSSNDNVYISARKSMTIWFYIHTIAKRAKAIALVDSGATENFMNLTYARWLRLPIHPLEWPRKIFNVDRTENKSSELKYYTDLKVQTGTTRSSLHFFLTNLGENKAILSYSWFAAT